MDFPENSREEFYSVEWAKSGPVDSVATFASACQRQRGRGLMLDWKRRCVNIAGGAERIGEWPRLANHGGAVTAV